MRGAGTDVTVIVPAFNERAAIADTVRRLRLRLPAAEILVVDDGSTDGMAAEVPSVDGVRLLRHAYNAGYGASISSHLSIPSRSLSKPYDLAQLRAVLAAVAADMSAA